MDESNLDNSLGPVDQRSNTPEFDAALDVFAAGVELIGSKRKLRRTPEENNLELLASLLKVKSKTALFHYTTAAGIQGIVEQGRFHASAAYFMNDSSEIEYGCRLFGNILFKHAKTYKTIDTLASLLVHKVARKLHDINSMRNQLSQTYVVCFCEKPNLLSQWRAYGQNGGYSIGFDKESLQKFKTEGNIFDVVLRKVIYQEHQQTALMKDILSDCIPELEKNEIESKFASLDARAKAFCIPMFEYVLQNFALREIVRLKHPAFEEENEWRLIAQPSPVNKDESKVIAGLKFRPSRQVPTPYIELIPDSKLLPIFSIQYGPTLEKKRVEHALTMLFKKHGYPEIRIDGSEIPVLL